MTAGTADDSLFGHLGDPFSTRDRDHDAAKGNCAVVTQGAWWYTYCHDANLNGVYYKNGSHPDKAGKGIIWPTWKGSQSVKRAEMKIRPANF